MRAAAALLLAALATRAADALYFYLAEGEARCFIEEVPPETLIVGNYKNPDFVPFGSTGFTGSGVKYEVKDPTGALVKTGGCDNVGRFALTSSMGGEYAVCFASNASAAGRWGGGRGRRFRVDLSLEVGEGGVDYTEVAKKEHLNQLEVEVRRLNDKLKDILREQAYQKEREVAFRRTTDSTAARLQWWSLLQASVLVASGVWQILHLKAFFKSKKVV